MGSVDGYAQSVHTADGQGKSRPRGTGDSLSFRYPPSRVQRFPLRAEPPLPLGSVDARASVMPAAPGCVIDALVLAVDVALDCDSDNID